MKYKRGNYVVFLIGLAIVIISFFLMRPVFTGYITITEIYNYTENMGLTISKSDEYLWILQNKGNLKKISINARFSGDGYAKAYLRYNDTDYLILDSSQEEEGLVGVTGFAVLNETNEIVKNQTLVNETLEEQVENETSTNETLVNTSIENISETNVSEYIQNLTILNISETNVSEQITVNKSITNQSVTNLSKTIRLRLDYYNDSSYDTDNDGIEDIDGVVDLSVDAEFNFNATNDHLCTRWSINNNNICYGNSDCCAFIDLESSSDNWDDIFYSYFDKDGAGYDNIVSAQVVYFSYNLTELEAEVIYSNISSRNVIFSTPYKEFRDICLETCSLPGFNASSYVLVFEVNNSIIEIESIAYSIEKEKVVNNAPKLIKNISDVSIVDNYTINLSEYFFDEDVLEFSYYETDGISVSIEGNIAVISGDVGVRSMFFIANDSSLVTVSNVFRVNVTEEDFEETLVQGKAEINKPVKWVKKIKLKQSVGSIQVNIIEHAFNISVNNVSYPNRTLIINHSSDIEYYTPAPILIEGMNGEILIEGKVNYTNVLAYADAKDNLYWLSNERDLIYLLDNNIRYGDSVLVINKTGLEDSISLKHPEFSEVEYEGIIDYNATKDFAVLNVTINNESFKLIFRLNNRNNLFSKESNAGLSTVEEIEDYFRSNEELKIGLDLPEISSLLNLTFSKGSVYWTVPYLPSKFVIE